MMARWIRGSVFLTSLFALASSTACTGSEARNESSPSSEPGAMAVPVEARKESSALAAAHEAYLTGDFVGMGERIRDVLLDSAAGSLAKDNALALLDKAYETQNGKLPSRFVLPPEVENMKLSAMRGQSMQSTYGNVFLWLQAKNGFAAHVKEMAVRRLPDEPLLDLQAGRGKLAIRHVRAGYEDLVLEVTGVDTPPADGVYSIHLGLDDGRSVDGWVIARGLAASTSPQVSSPTPSISFSDPNPELRWKPFTSPQYGSFEQRSLSIYVHDEGRKRTAWDYWVGSPGDLSSVRVGKHPGAPETKLTPGTYWFALTASEERKFGPVRLSRSSQTGVPFNVVE